MHIELNSRLAIGFNLKQIWPIIGGMVEIDEILVIKDELLYIVKKKTINRRLINTIL